MARDEDNTLENEVEAADAIYFGQVKPRLEASEQIHKSLQTPRVYYNNPSEVVYVPPRGRIRTELRKILRESDKDVPVDLSDWADGRCYAVYFNLMGVEKYDPKKHN